MISLSPLNSYINFLQVHTILLKCVHLFCLFGLFLILNSCWWLLYWITFFSFFSYRSPCFGLFWTPHFFPQHFIMKNFITTQKVEVTGSEHPYTHYLYSTINIVLCLLYPISIHPSMHSTMHEIQNNLMFLVHFTVSSRHQCTSQIMIPVSSIW